MLNHASKFALGLAGVALVAALFADDRAGALVLVGVLLAAAVIAFGLGRAVGHDPAPFIDAEAATASTALEPTDVGRPSFGPLALAIGATVAFAGGAVGPRWVLAGGLLTLVGVGVWAFDTYRTPGVIAARDAANVDNRLLGPIALPVASFLLAITLAYSFSRVLLAINETASWVVAFLVAAVVLSILWLIASRGPAARVVSAVAGVGLIGVLVAGGAGAGVGEREFEGHEDTTPMVEITAHNIAFDRSIIALPADTLAKVTFANLDVGTFHNVAVYTNEEPGAPLFNGKPIAHGKLQYQFRTPKAGTYRYVCDFHPAMKGELRVTDAPAAEKENHE